MQKRLQRTHTIRSHGTNSAMLERMLHSGTSKTKKLVPVQPDVPLFCKSHDMTSILAWLIFSWKPEWGISDLETKRPGNQSGEYVTSKPEWRLGKRKQACKIVAQ